MKKYIVLFILLFASPCAAFLPVFTGGGETTVGGGGGGETYFCDSCPDATNGGDLACETFDASGYDCSSPAWTETLNSGTIDENNTPTGDWICTDENTYNTKVTMSGATRTELDLGSEYTHSYGLLYAKVISESLSSGQSSPLFYGWDGTNTSFYVRLVEDGTGVFLRIYQRNEANGDTTYDVGSPDYITIGTDVIRFTWDHDAGDTGGSQWKVRVGEGGTERTINFSDAETDTGHGLRYFGLGFRSDYTNWVGEFDYIRIDDDTVPSICAGDS